MNDKKRISIKMVILTIIVILFSIYAYNVMYNSLFIVTADGEGLNRLSDLGSILLISVSMMIFFIISFIFFVEDIIRKEYKVLVSLLLLIVNIFSLLFSFIYPNYLYYQKQNEYIDEVKRIADTYVTEKKLYDLNNISSIESKYKIQDLFIDNLSGEPRVCVYIDNFRINNDNNKWGLFYDKWEDSCYSTISNEEAINYVKEYYREDLTDVAIVDSLTYSDLYYSSSFKMNLIVNGENKQIRLGVYGTKIKIEEK